MKKRLIASRLRGRSLISPIVWTAVITFLISALLLILTPVGNFIGRNFLFSFISPEVDVRISSLLFSRDSKTNTYRIKMRFWIYSSDYIDRDIQLIKLTNLTTAERLDLSDQAPIAIRDVGILLDSVDFRCNGFDSLFALVPTETDARWQLEYQVSGFDKIKYSYVESSSLLKLHYLLFPSGNITPGRGIKHEPIVVAHVTSISLTELDGPTWLLAKDTLGLLLYPREFVRIGIDRNRDGNFDVVIESAKAKELMHSKEGRITDIFLNFEHFLERVSGFVILARLPKIVPTEVRAHFMNPSNEKELVAMFGEVIDLDLSLFESDFIYWKYDITLEN